MQTNRIMVLVFRAGIGISLIGDFETDNPPEIIQETLRNLVDCAVEGVGQHLTMTKSHILSHLPTAFYFPEP